MSGLMGTGDSREAILLAGDHDPCVRRLEALLGQNGSVKVRVARDGTSGLQQARAIHPDIVITEILMPSLDGLSVCRALKSDPNTQDIPVIVMSVLSAEDRAREAGADGYLRKPWDDSCALELINRLCPTPGAAIQ